MGWLVTKYVDLIKKNLDHIINCFVLFDKISAIWRQNFYEPFFCYLLLYYSGSKVGLGQVRLASNRSIWKNPIFESGQVRPSGSNIRSTWVKLAFRVKCLCRFGSGWLGSFGRTNLYHICYNRNLILPSLFDFIPSSISKRRKKWWQISIYTTLEHRIFVNYLLIKTFLKATSACLEVC